MVDPVLAFVALAVATLSIPMAQADPGPNPACPSDMRLVVGTHYDEMEHYCVDPRSDVKDTHCYRYFEGLSAEEGAATTIRVCMDQYEAPNVRGAKPLVMQSYKKAQSFCAQHKKRVCTEEEWEHACEGPEHR